LKYLTAAIYTSPLLLAVLGYGYHSYGAAAGLIPIILMYLGVKQGFFPIIRQGELEGATGRNWPLLVVMEPDAPMYKAVLAQEIWESIHKTNPINLIRTRSGKGAQELELMGHEVEVQVAVLLYGVKEHEYRKKEAESMKGYSQFKGWDAARIEAGMIEKTNAAQSWVARNQKRFI
jgi:hypothetical protein